MPLGDVLHREARRAALRQHRLDAEHVAGERRGAVVHGRLAHGGPHVIALEQIHSGALRERVPARPLEQREERRLVQVPERITLEWVDSQVDGGECAHGHANVFQNTMRCFAGIAANAFAPYVGSSRRPCPAATSRARSPAGDGAP